MAVSLSKIDTHVTIAIEQEVREESWANDILNNWGQNNLKSDNYKGQPTPRTKDPYKNNDFSHFKTYSS